MNRFVHRILSHRTRGAVAIDDLLRDAAARKLVWFGDFHSEPRAIALQNEILAWMARHGPGANRDGKKARLHLVMEHFSSGSEMGDILQRHRTDEEFTFEELHDEYRRIGTEGHDLEPYRGLLDFCQQVSLRDGALVSGRRGGDNPIQDEVFFSADGGPGGDCCEIYIHGGFIPRPLAARLNKSTSLGEKQALFDEIFRRGFLPGPGKPMHHYLFDGTDNSRDLILKGSMEHYRLIESLMTGRDLYVQDVESTKLDEEAIDQDTPLAKLYQAQLLKDHAMGYLLAELMLDHAAREESVENRYLVVTGLGHMKHSLGVPECLMGYLKAESLHSKDDERRKLVLKLIDNLQESCETSLPSGQISIGCQMLYETYLEEVYPPLAQVDELLEEEQDEAKKLALNELYQSDCDLMDKLLLDSEIVKGPLLNASSGIGGFGRPCADYLYIYDEDDDNFLPSKELRGDTVNEKEKQAVWQAAKAETLDAYNRVGKTAKRQGNIARAKAIMLHLGYTQDDLDAVGDDDIYNFQGVANPHIVAKIKYGERVLDVGSGLGVDSFLAAHSCGAGVNAGMVVGVDLAGNEVKHSQSRALQRGYNPNQVQFIAGDAEKLDEALQALEAPKFDVCISNGAFCLIPDKRKAFMQVYNALSPGGRMAVSTTTIKADKGLESDVEWPVCMRMFVSLDELKPMCESAGFKNVQIINADSPLEGMELPEEAVSYENECAESGRFKIHGKYAQHFKHLEKMDMDEICSVVTVYGEK
mmetsp:Transcript_22737/g.46112  ORF Transcript_22737/g.46112 Transcript_22737/m.46112 type:complete len:756 (-) Transcript_22737:125-2392(-)